MPRGRPRVLAKLMHTTPDHDSHLAAALKLDMEIALKSGPVKQYVPADRSAPQLQGAEQKRFLARIALRKYSKKVPQLRAFVTSKELSDSQCEYIFAVIKKWKLMYAHEKYEEEISK